MQVQVNWRRLCFGDRAMTDGSCWFFCFFFQGFKDFICQFKHVKLVFPEALFVRFCSAFVAVSCLWKSDVTCWYEFFSNFQLSFTPVFNFHWTHRRSETCICVCVCVFFGEQKHKENVFLFMRRHLDFDKQTHARARRLQFISAAWAELHL